VKPVSKAIALQPVNTQIAPSTKLKRRGDLLLNVNTVVNYAKQNKYMSNAYVKLKQRLLRLSLPQMERKVQKFLILPPFQMAFPTNSRQPLPRTFRKVLRRTRTMASRNSAAAHANLEALAFAGLLGIALHVGILLVICMPKPSRPPATTSLVPSDSPK
jgi:hypothetical protein